MSFEVVNIADLFVMVHSLDHAQHSATIFRHGDAASDMTCVCRLPAAGVRQQEAG